MTQNASPDPAVDVSHLTVSFGEFKAVDDISFAVPKGEIFGFLGANGAGKTTTIRVLCGLLEPSSGKVRVAGLDAASEREQIKPRVGYMSQKFTLYDDLTVAENLLFAASLRKIPPDRLKSRTAALFEFIKFEKNPRALVRDLPGGVKQQLALVAAVLHEPEILFLDEPTAGVSPAARARFWALIRELAAKGITIFVTTHYMDEAEQCERVALMRAGAIIALDQPGRLKTYYFPETIIEILPALSAPAGWEAVIRNHPSVVSLQPWGLRFHAIVRDTASWDKFAKAHAKEFSSKHVTPSMEEVFIRVVGGTGEP